MYCQTGNVHVQEVKVIAVKIFWPARLLRPWAHRIVLHCIAIASYYTIILRCLHNPFLSLCSLSPNTRSLSISSSRTHTHSLSVALIRLLFHDCSIFVFVISFWDKFASFPFHFIVISCCFVDCCIVYFRRIRLYICIPLTLRHTKWALIAIIIIVIVDLNVMRAVFYIAFCKCHDCGRHNHFMFNAFVKQSIDSFQLVCF